MRHIHATLNHRRTTHSAATLIATNRQFLVMSHNGKATSRPMPMSLADYPGDDLITIHTSDGILQYPTTVKIRHLRPGQLGANTNTTHRL